MCKQKCTAALRNQYLTSYIVTAWLSNLVFQMGSDSKSIFKWNWFHFAFSGIYVAFPFQCESQTGSWGDGPGFAPESGCSRGVLQFMLGIVAWQKRTVTLVLDLCSECLKLCCASECWLFQSTICSAVVTLMPCDRAVVRLVTSHGNPNQYKTVTGAKLKAIPRRCAGREAPPACFGAVPCGAGSRTRSPRVPSSSGLRDSCQRWYLTDTASNLSVFKCCCEEENL